MESPFISYAPVTRYFLNDKGYGLIFGKPSDIYKRADTKELNYMVVRNMKESFVTDPSKNIVERLFSNAHSTKQQNAYERVSDLLRYFMIIHKNFIENRKLGSTTKEIKESYTQFSAIFVEVGPLMKHTVVYVSLMYMCLINMGIELPEFYLLVSFPTKVYDSVEHYIFNDPTDTTTVLTVESIVEDLDESRKRLRAPEGEPNYTMFDVNTYDEIVRCSSLIIITEDRRGWQDRISSQVRGRNTLKFDDAKSYRVWYHDFNSEKNATNPLPVVIINTPDEIVNEDLDINIIVFDSRIKVEVDLHYLGNVKRSREANPEWYMYYISLLNKKFPGAKVFLDRTREITPTTMGTKERTPISDVLYFKNEGISLLELYQQFYNTTTEYTRAIASSQDTLSRLGYFDKGAPLIKEGLHPFFPRLMQLWIQKEFPKFAFLIVVAVVTSYNHRYTEIRKDDEQSSRFDEMLEHYLDLMKRHESGFPNDTYGINEKLRKLCSAYMVPGEDEYNYYAYINIKKSLVELIYENFENYIITLQVDSYRSKQNQNMIWILSGSTSNGPQPKSIFPLVVYSTERVKKVALYISLG